MHGPMPSVGELLNRGLRLHQAGKVQEAVAVYRQVLAVRPEQPDALHLLGVALYQTGQLPQSLECLRKAVQLQPANPAYANSLGVALLAAGRADEAIGYFRRALRLKPDYADAHSNLGNAHFEKGQYAQAIASCRRALAISPDHADALYNLGNALASQGHLDEAIASYRQAIRSRPRFAKAHNNLAGTLVLKSRPEEAIEHYRQAVAIDPDFAEAHKNLASIYKDRGQVDEAIAGFRAALCAKPDYPDALNRLGVTLFEQGQLDEAAACYRRAIEVKPEFAEAHNNLGTLLLEQEKYDEAVACYQRALAIQPLSADTHFNLGNALKAQGKLAEAVASYQRALDIRPKQPKVYNNLGNALRLMGRLAEAVDCYAKAIQEAPKDVMLLENLAGTYKQMGLVDQAATAYHRVLPLRPKNPLYELRIESLCPPVFGSLEAMDRFHERLHAALDRYCAMDLRLDPQEIVGVGCEPPFDVAYHGRDERGLREKFAAVFRHCFPKNDPPTGSGTPRIAMVVTRDHEGIFLRGTRGLIDHLDPERFELSIACAESGLKRLQAEIANPHVTYLPVPDNFEKWADTIRQGRFDLLYFWEVGSDPFNYFLPFLKLAPVQCLGWGTNYTSGVPQVDYYISSNLVEVPQADEHYTEKLVRLETLPTYQYRPKPPEALKGRQSFGFSDAQHIYFCPHNIRKFHPEFDPLVQEILRRDPAGVVVIPKPQYEPLEIALLSRLDRTIADVTERIVFVPWMPYPEYLNFTAVADVLLDPLHYGGGVTSYDGLAVGTPIVTLPSQYQRGRYTLGCYRKIEVLDCVASSAEEYVELAVRLGSDCDYRHSVKERILAACHLLFEDLDAVRQHEAFFEQAIDVARRS